MSDFLNQMRHLQQETKKKMISPDEVYEKLNEFQLDTALNQIKRMIAEDCQKNPDSRVLKGRYMLFCGGRVARIDQTPDTINEYYRIDRNIIAHDYDDFASSNNNVTWLDTRPLYTVKEDYGFFSGEGAICLTKRGEDFLEELTEMCADEDIDITFGAHAAWSSGNPAFSGEVFVPFGKTFKTKSRLHSDYIYYEYTLKL